MSKKTHVPAKSGGGANRRSAASVTSRPIDPDVGWRPPSFLRFYDATAAQNAQDFAQLRASGQRLESIDCIRGLSIILMLGQHFFYDLMEFSYGADWLFYNPFLAVLHPFFAGLFLFLSGVSSRISHSNMKRGLLTAAAALAVTLVTYCMDHFFGMESLITFGILHLLAFCMIFFALFHKLLDKIPHLAAPVIYIVLLVVTYKLFYLRYVGSITWLFPLGLIGDGYYWSDFFPIFPWVFPFLLGTWLGPYLVNGYLPRWLYTFRYPLLAWIGRHTLVIYLVQQPVLYGITMFINAALPL